MTTRVFNNQVILPEPTRIGLAPVKPGGSMPLGYRLKKPKLQTIKLNASAPTQCISKAEKEATIWYETDKKLKAKDAAQENLAVRMGFKEEAPETVYKVHVTNFPQDDTVVLNNAPQPRGPGLHRPEVPTRPDPEPRGPSDLFELHPKTGEIRSTSEKAIQTMGEAMTSKPPAGPHEITQDRMQTDPVVNQIIHNYNDQAVTNYNQTLHNIDATQNHLQHTFNQIQQDNRSYNQLNQITHNNENIVNNLLTDARTTNQLTVNSLLQDYSRQLHLTGASADQIMQMTNQLNGASSSSQVARVRNTTDKGQPNRRLIEGVPQMQVLEGPGTRSLENTNLMPVLEGLRRMAIEPRSPGSALMRRPTMRVRMNQMNQQQQRAENVQRLLTDGTRRNHGGAVVMRRSPRLHNRGR